MIADIFRSEDLNTARSVGDASLSQLGTVSCSSARTDRQRRQQYFKTGLMEGERVDESPAILERGFDFAYSLFVRRVGCGVSTLAAATPRRSSRFIRIHPRRLSLETDINPPLLLRNSPAESRRMQSTVIGIR